MAIAAKTDAVAPDIAELGAELSRTNNRLQAMEAALAGFANDRNAIAAAADGWITKRDVMFAGGGAVAGGGVAYLGSTQGWWELNPLNVGIGVVGGAGIGFAAGRLLQRE
jgi:multidrug resistance efflux pump